MTNPKKVKKFGKWALKRRAEVEEREKNRRDERYNSPPTSGHGYFMATIYQKGREKIAAGKFDQIKTVARELGQSASETKLENAFAWLLVAFYGALGAVDDSTRAKCKRLALQLFYAHVHDVEPENIMPFLYAAGSVARIRRLLKQSHPDLFVPPPKRRPRRPARSDRARERREMNKRYAESIKTAD